MKGQNFRSPAVLSLVLDLAETLCRSESSAISGDSLLVLSVQDHLTPSTSMPRPHGGLHWYQIPSLLMI
jgi:hypothetical protein